ncbi:MAG: DUF4410 domain-containing protein [Thermodesulfobacteriota bacterium]
MMDLFIYFSNLAKMLIIFVFLVCALGCATKMSVEQPFAPSIGNSSLNDKVKFSMGECEVLDSRGSMELCKKLQDEVKYRLFKQGLYEKNTNESSNEVRMSITYYRNVSNWGRAWVGALSGKDGMDVTVNVVDRVDGKNIGTANVSNYNYTAADYTEKMMCKVVGAKIVDFLSSGTGK